MKKAATISKAAGKAKKAGVKATGRLRHSARAVKAELKRRVAALDADLSRDAARKHEWNRMLDAVRFWADSEEGQKWFSLMVAKEALRPKKTVKTVSEALEAARARLLEAKTDVLGFERILMAQGPNAPVLVPA